MINVKITEQAFAAMNGASMFKKNEFASFAIEWVARYFQQHQALPQNLDAEIPTRAEIAHCDYESLPGMSLAVIQSHFIRFPKVTLSTYKQILAHLNQQHAEGKLKNPEAAAYGLCKLAQNGKLPEGIISASPAAQKPAAQTIVPKEALMPFAK